MKTFLPLSRLSILLTVLMTASAVAQVGVFPGGAYTGETVPGVDTTGMFDPSAGQSRHFLTRLATKFPGNVWFRYTGASEGLGYDTGGFFTLGAKTRLGTDLLDGRWTFEARGHLAHEQGQVFANIGVERIFTITPAKSDVGFNFFFDADGDASQNFGHDFYGVGVGGFLRHEKFEVRANGYIPVGTTGYRLGTPEDCFFLNHIIDQPGIDTALQGADLEVSLRPWHWQMLQGHVDVGGYYYADVDEDITGVGSFGGVRVRGRVTTNRGVSVEAEYNYDERFKATIIGRIVISTGTFGQFSRLGRDLDPTIRSDHIVKWHQDVTFLIDPDTGRPYYVNHVDNTAAPGGDGTVESPFDSLADVDPLQGGASSPDDIILVREGDGTTTGYDTGITLQDRQYLLGDGSPGNLLPTVRGTNFLLCNVVGGNKPTLTNIIGPNIVTLANGNTVSGVGLDGNNPVLQNVNGIFGGTITGGVTINYSCINDVTMDGIHIDSITGDVIITDNIIDDVGDDAIDIGSVAGIMAAGGMIDISRNMITDTNLTTPGVLDGDGITLAMITGGGTTFNFDDNMLARIGGDGIEIQTVTGTGGNTWDFTGNVIDTPAEDAIYIDTVAGVGDTFTFTMNTTTDAGFNGIFLNDITDATGTATYSFVMNTSTGNAFDGINLEDFGGASVLFSGNTTSDNMLNGIEVARGTPLAGMALDVDVLNHISDDNDFNGGFFDAFDGDLDILGGTFTDNGMNGAFIRNVTNSVVDTEVDIMPNVDGTPSTFTGNGVGAGAGIAIELNATAPPASLTIVNITASTIDANVNGVDATVSGAMNDLRVTAMANASISQQSADAFEFDVATGAMGTFTAMGNMTMVNNGIVAGDAFDLNVLGGAGGTSTLTAVIADNAITTVTGGSGVDGFVTGDSDLDLRVDTNTFTGVLDGVNLTFASTNTTSPPSPQSVFVVDNMFTTVTTDGLRVTSGAMTELDLNISGNTITNPGDEGMDLNFTGGVVRASILGNTIVDTNAVGLSSDGIDLAISGATTFLGRITGNMITNMGVSGNTTIMGATPVPDPLWGRGILVSTSGTSMSSLLVNNNLITGSGLGGLEIFTTGTSSLDAIVDSNGMLGNDVTSVVDTTAPPPAPLPATLKLAGRFDFRAATDAASTMCLAIAGNTASGLIVAGENFPITPPGLPVIGTGTMSIEEGVNSSAVTQTWTESIISGLPIPITIGAPSIVPPTGTCVGGYNARVGSYPGLGFTPTYPTFP